jgi:hypothetical protein
MYNIDLEPFKSDYETKKEILQRLRNMNLEEVYKNSKMKILQNTESEKLDTNFQIKENNNTNYFKILQTSKTSHKNISKPKFSSDSLKQMKHMKSVLGHISVQDTDIINPVPIYCICFSSNDQMIFTGDNNG